jgi:WD40 repeat protein
MRGRLLVALLTLAGCRTLPLLPDSTLTALTASGGGYLQGTPIGLRDPVVLNDVDFVYDAKFSDDGTRVAISRLGMKSFDLLVWAPQPSPPVKILEAPVNLHAFDVESVAFSPDGKWVAAVSRDGSVRVFDASTGLPAGGWLTEQPLVTVAFHPGGRYLAVGSESGLVTLLAVDAQAATVKFRFATELQVHQAQVRGLAFARDGRLFTAGWDKTVAVLATEEQSAAASSASVHFERKGGYAQLRGTINDVASVLFALDARAPQVLVLRSTLAQAIGLDPARLTDTATVTSSFGTQLARVAHGVRLSFKGLKLENVDAVICDACVPAEAQAVLGQGFTDAAELVFDETRGQALLKRKGSAEAKGEPLLAVTERHRFTFPAYPNDLSIDRAGKVLGLAFSETRGERNREVYEREMRNVVEPERGWDVGARVDAETGAVLQKYRGHRGVVATAAVSPDGATLATGGWDKKVLLHVGKEPLVEKFGLAVRRVRFSADGRWLAAAAWTPQNPLGDFKSDRSALVWELAYSEAHVVLR